MPITNYLAVRPPATRPTARIDRLSYWSSFGVYGWGGAQESSYWSRVVKDDEGTFTITVSLDKPARSTDTVTWAVTTGASTENDFWSTTQTKTVTFAGGENSFTIPMLMADKAKWFEEKAVIIELTSSTGLVIADGYKRCHVLIGPSTKPPLVSITTDTDSVATTGGTFDAEFVASYAPLEDLKVYYTLENGVGTSMKDKTSGPVQGAATISAGTTSTTETFTVATGVTSGDTVIVRPDYERDQVAYSEPRFDVSAQTFTKSNDVMVDENLWRSSSDIAGGYEEINKTATSWPALAMRPNTIATGGSTFTGGNDTGIDIVSVNQTATTKVVDPTTGDDAVWISAGPDTTTMGYLRMAFSSPFCEGESTFHIPGKEWVRGMYALENMGTEDASKGYDLHAIGVRTRTQDLDHQLRFADDTYGRTPGRSSSWTTGPNDVPTFGPMANGRTYWQWSRKNGHPTDFDWGVVDIEYQGELKTFVWFVHHIDPLQFYADGNDQTGTRPDGYEDAAYDESNPIYRPIWNNSSDSSNTPITFNSVKTNQRGTIIHSLGYQLSATEFSPHAPSSYWPCTGVLWTPRGGGLKHATPATAGTFTTTVS